MTTSTAARIFIDQRDGDGLCTSNPGEAFFWLIERRPRQAGYRSREFAQIADMAHHGTLSSEERSIASAYQFIVI